MSSSSSVDPRTEPRDDLPDAASAASITHDDDDADPQQKKLADGRQTREYKERKWRAKHLNKCNVNNKKRPRPNNNNKPEEEDEPQVVFLVAPRPHDDEQMPQNHKLLHPRADRRGDDLEDLPSPSPTSALGGAHTEQSTAAVHAWVAQHEKKNVHLVAALNDVDHQPDLAATSLPSLAELLAPYRNLTDRRPSGLHPSSSGVTAPPSLFVAEGTETVRLLLRQALCPPPHLDPIPVLSVFCKAGALLDPPAPLAQELEALWSAAPPRSQRDTEDPRDKGPHDAPTGHCCAVLVAANSHVMSHVAGFPVARGALACGSIPAHRTLAWLLDTYLPRCLGSVEKTSGRRSRHLRLLALDGASDPANVGSALRCASAFGICAVLLSGDCADPWYRKAIRVSMGHVFRVPCVRVEVLAPALQRLQSQHGVVSYAAVVGEANRILEQMGQGACASLLFSGHCQCRRPHRPYILTLFCF